MHFFTIKFTTLVCILYLYYVFYFIKYLYSYLHRYLHSNNLSGEIPDCISSLSNLQHLFVFIYLYSYIYIQYNIEF